MQTSNFKHLISNFKPHTSNQPRFKFPSFKPDDPLRSVCQFHIVCNEYEGRSGFPVKIKQQVGDMTACYIIQVAGWLIGEEYLRVVGKSPCE